MTRETKVGLLVGMGVILLIGIMLTDHLSLARTRQLPNMTDFAPVAQHDLTPPTVIETDETANRRVEAPGRKPRRPPHPPRHSARRRDAASGPDPQAARHLVEAETGVLPPRDPDRSARTAHPRPGPVAIVHIVRPGEGLWELSNRYYGHGQYWWWIRDANPGAVAADSTIRTGAKLKIPERPEPVDGADAAPTVDRPTPRVDDAPDKARSAAEPIRVAAGDTFGSLALDHLGTSRKWRTLFDANRQRLELHDPRNLRVGMLVHLPQVADADPPPAAQRPSPPAAGTEGTYVVKQGDSLSSVAARFLGDARHWRRIYDANRDILSDPDTLPHSRQIVIP